MKAVKAYPDAPGDRLRYEEVPDPLPGSGQVVLQVEASGINFGDLWQDPLRPGSPYIPGMEAAGTIVEVGPDVDSIRVGERVLVLVNHGAYAEKMVVDASQLAVLPDFLPSSVAAALPINYCTAHLILTDTAPVEPGERVLVHAAGGGVGTAAVQIASMMGGRVFATVSSPAKTERVRELGAEEVIDYLRDDFVEAIRDLTGGRGVDLILDGVGGEVGRRSLDALAPFGRVVYFGSSSGKEPTYPALRLLLANQAVLGFNLSLYMQQRPDRSTHAMAEVLNWAATGRITPVIGREFPLSQASEAHAFLASRKSLGKLLLRPDLS